MTPAPPWVRAGDDSMGNAPAPAAQCGPPPASGCAKPRARHECGDLDMRIARDGTWYYKGSPIGRKELVCLFASVLKREADGSYMLETPVERGRIEVEDAPFIAVEMVWRDCDCGGGGAIRQCLSFRTNCDEVVPANAEHPIRVQLDPRTREPRPYIMIRPGLEAKINRAVFYEMVALAVTETVDGRDLMGVWSEGVFFPIDEAVADPLLAAE
ncbi:DUF1285 domain-containing protein [Sediminicoccus sp. KRV36]|uniref:DUF1285 domain-containing protein n=1 Tax=Sediminicoccus sp. KRV36 TaxID=3133721 RepID=UPI00200C8C27|nr:DUF1285 domain-containing protein [Sediminicoccus rosea]UPY35764.1 DUF1285 domain-containing protein [Sediminicoccus rosea]